MRQMTTPERRVLELALLGLETERRRIEQEMNELHARLGSAGRVAVRTHNSTRLAHNKGKSMSAAQKKKISQAMKARWKLRRSNA